MTPGIFLIPLDTLDMAASFLLAFASSCRCRMFGGHFTGAVVLGFLCGMCAPLLRECLLQSSGVRLILSELSGLALSGGVAGALTRLPRISRHGSKAFFLSDSLGIGLTSCLAVVSGVSSRLPAVGSLALGLLIGLAPGLLRDMALGDVAQAVEEDWYATSLALGCMLTILLLTVAKPLIAVPCGCLLVLALRFWRRGKTVG